MKFMVYFDRVFTMKRIIIYGMEFQKKFQPLKIACIFLLFLMAGCAGSKYYMVRHEPLFSREEKLGKEKIQLVAKKYDTGKETTEESLDISSLTRVTDNENMVEISNINISPDGETLIFQVYTSGIKEDKYFNIWSVRVSDGKGLRFITNAETNDYTPCFTPDGNSIVFASGRSGATKLWKIRKAGTGGFVQLTFGPSTDGQPDISPDAKRIVFASLSPVMRLPHIWVMNSNGTDLTELCEGFSPKWTPDAKKIVFISIVEIDKNPVRQLWLMNADGTYITQILNIMEGDCFSLAVSPDGKRIAFSSNMHPGAVRQGRLTNNYDIWLINIDGSNLTQLTTNIAYDGDPVWSPDGKYIYFCSNRGMKWDIWRIMSTARTPERAEAEPVVKPKIEIKEEPRPVEPETKTEVYPESEATIEITPSVPVTEEKPSIEIPPVVKEKVEPEKKEQKATKKVKVRRLKRKPQKTVSPAVPAKKPMAPVNVVATPGGGLVILTWNPGTRSRIGGYFIYRTRTQGKNYARVNKKSFKGRRYVDPEVENGVRYYYVVTAIDRTGKIESNYSSEVTAFPEHSSILKARREAAKKKK